jgi:agmatinase
VTSDQTNALTAMRVASARIAQNFDRYDFVLGGPLFDHRPIRVVDCGDVPGDPTDLEAHYRRAEKAARRRRVAARANYFG